MAAAGRPCAVTTARFKPAVGQVTLSLHDVSLRERRRAGALWDYG